MKKTIQILSFLAVIMVPMAVVAQEYSYNHDPAKLNQITIMESGYGSFEPSWYYQALHQSYSKRAAVTNKSLYRTQAGSYLYLQQDEADSIQVYMEKRAAIEALNMADRAGGSADLAWNVEGPKVSAKMSSFIGNINRVIGTGGSVEERNYWLQYYNCYQCAIKATQDAYMPNAQRKREYLKIYADVTAKNDLLVKYLVRINNRRLIQERLAAVADTCKADKRSIVAMAMARWSASVGMTSNQFNIEE